MWHVSRIREVNWRVWYSVVGASRSLPRQALCFCHWGSQVWFSSLPSNAEISLVSFSLIPLLLKSTRVSFCCLHLWIPTGEGFLGTQVWSAAEPRKETENNDQGSTLCLLLWRLSFFYSLTVLLPCPSLPVALSYFTGKQYSLLVENPPLGHQNAWNWIPEVKLTECEALVRLLRLFPHLYTGHSIVFLFRSII